MVVNCDFIFLLNSLSIHRNAISDVLLDLMTGEITSRFCIFSPLPPFVMIERCRSRVRVCSLY